jgi:hypothetical protein
MIVQLVDKLLDDHIYAEIADILNEQEFRPGGSARPGQGHTRFTALRIAYLVHRYALRSRYNRLRDRGMLMAAEAAARLGIHEATCQGQSKTRPLGRSKSRPLGGWQMPVSRPARMMV